MNLTKDTCLWIKVVALADCENHQRAEGWDLAFIGLTNYWIKNRFNLKNKWWSGVEHVSIENI